MHDDEVEDFSKIQKERRWCDIVGLLPIMFSVGVGANMMKHIAAPMIGGLVTSFLLELLIYPALFFLWKRKKT